MDDINLDAKPPVTAEAPVPSTEATDSKDTQVADTTAEVAKTEGAEGSPDVKQEEPWHKDPRFKTFLEEKKSIEERLQAFEGIEQDPDFAAFLAMKRQKEAIAAEAQRPKVDYSRMTAEEYATHVAEQAKEAARAEYANLAESNKKGDQMSREAITFAESCGVEKTVFQKEFAPKIIAYYEKMAKQIGTDKMDAFVQAVPPREVFKNFYFDKAAEIGVKKYKENVDKAKNSGFEMEGHIRDEAEPKDSKGKFDKLWLNAFGQATELPFAAIDKRR
jgi:hypothetical protein